MNTMMTTFTEDQLAFAELAAKALAATSSEATQLSPAGLAGLRNQLAALGLPLLAVPEDLGGAGLVEPDLVLILEEVGYAGAPLAIADTLGVVAPMLARHGTQQQRAAWLPALADGEVLGAALCPDTGLEDQKDAEVVLVESHGRVHVLSVEDLPSNGAVLPSESALSADDATSVVSEFRARAAWVSAAVLNGVSRRLLDLSLEYARTRLQFGVPIGSFQAIKHGLADVAAGIESARPTAWQAAYSLATNEATASLQASVAKARASRVGALANDHALQVHGGIGFTREHPLHRWLLCGHALESRWGTADAHELTLGRFALQCDSLLAVFAP